MQRPGAMPRPPTSPAASSVRMSPNMFVVTTTSKLCGSRTRRMAKVSTMTSSSATSGNSLATFEGKLTSSKLAKLAKCSRDSAHRDIQDLIKQGAIKKNAGGSRSTSYHLNL